MSEQLCPHCGRPLATRRDNRGNERCTACWAIAPMSADIETGPIGPVSQPAPEPDPEPTPAPAPTRPVKKRKHGNSD